MAVRIVIVTTKAYLANLYRQALGLPTRPDYHTIRLMTTPS